MHLGELERLKGEFERFPVGDDARLTQIRNELVSVIELALPEAQAVRFIAQVQALSFEPIYYSNLQYARGRDPAWERARAQMIGIIGAIEHNIALRAPPAPVNSVDISSATEPVAAPTALTYVHGYRDDDVLALAAELRSHGVPCELDIYETASPDGGWSRHMVKLMKMPFVIVVCSQPYYERYTLEDASGSGGVTMESGLLSRRFVDSKGQGHGIIPVVFDEEDTRWCPDFLRDETYYLLPRDYDALQAALTKQQLHEKPALGPIRRVVAAAPQRWKTEATQAPSERTRRRLMLLQLEDGAFSLPYCELARDATIRVTLLPDDGEGAGHVAALRQYTKPFGIAWNLDATVVRRQKYREIVTDAGERIELELVEERPQYGAWVDMGYNGIPADQLAVLRARRILLDEHLGDATGLPFAMNDQRALSLESFVAGRFVFDGTLTAKQSPLPVVAGIVKSDADLVEAGRLWCVLLLKLTRTVERIVKLDLERLPDGIRVEFAGYRAKVYDNVEPFRIDVSGICPLP